MKNCWKQSTWCLLLKNLTICIIPDKTKAKGNPGASTVVRSKYMYIVQLSKSSAIHQQEKNHVFVLCWKDWVVCLLFKISEYARMSSLCWISNAKSKILFTCLVYIEHTRYLTVYTTSMSCSPSKWADLGSVSSTIEKNTFWMRQTCTGWKWAKQLHCQSIIPFAMSYDSCQ